MQETTPLTSRTKLPSAAEKSDYVRTNFDAIARNYDRFNDWISFGMHRLWKKRMVQETGLTGKKARVLDLCCGSGDISLAFARILADGSEITSLDFSREMLNVLSHRLLTFPSRGVQIRPLEGDAMKLNYSSEFDAASMSFGLRNVTDRAVCLRGILRALKPGAPFVLLDVGKPPSIFMPFFRLFFEGIVPKIGHWIHGEKHSMYDYLPASARAYPDQKAMKKELEDAGFVNVRIINFSLGAAGLHVARKPE